MSTENRSRAWLWVVIGGGAFFLFVLAVFSLVYLAVKNDNKTDFAGGFGDKIAVVDLEGVILDAKEFANGYSELNIPEEQQERFRHEAVAVAEGDLEAMPADAGFIRALEYGLPPTAGIGIGIDRLVMLLSEVEAIRDVILFPMLRPEAGS